MAKINDIYMDLYISNNKSKDMEATTKIIAGIFKYFNNYCNGNIIRLYDKNEILNNFSKIMESIKYLTMEVDNRYEHYYDDLERLMVCSEAIDLPGLINKNLIKIKEVIGKLPSFRIDVGDYDIDADTIREIKINFGRFYDFNIYGKMQSFLIVK